MEEMSDLVDWYLSHTSKKVNWKKVKETYGKEKVEEIKKFRAIMREK